MGTTFTEKRTDRRLELTLPLEYSLPASPDAFPRDGQTRNVSSGGVYFETDSDPLLEPDSPISLRIAVPQRQDTGGPPLALYGEGRVLRVERAPSRAANAKGNLPRWGVAVVFSAKPTVRMSSLVEYLMSEVQPPTFPSGQPIFPPPRANPPSPRQSPES